jgi:SAM-dependent methyltransferase
MEDFFAFGRTDTANMMTFISSLGLTLGKHRAVDFGCGLGRSTQALVSYFDEVYGVDIAPSILTLARAYNQHPDKCRYILNSTNDLAMFEDNSIDFACSFATLQHVEPRVSAKYIKEFLRILVPGGVLLFNLPSVPERTGKGFLLGLMPNRVINLYRKRKYGRKTYSIPQRHTIEIIERTGGTVMACRRDHVNTISDHWVTVEYCVSKQTRMSRTE